MRRIAAWVVGGLLIISGTRLLLVSVSDRSGAATAERAIASLRYLSSDLEGKADRMQSLFPEGRVFTLALTGIAWANLGLEGKIHPSGATASSRAALELSLASESRIPFGPTTELPHGLFYDAWTTRLQTGVVRLARERDRVREADTLGLRDRCARLGDVLENGPRFPDSYPGQAWPADAVVAAAALEGCAQTVTPSLRRIARAWVERAALEVDPETGLMPHAAGSPTARGSSSALMIPFLAEVDPAFARGQFLRALRDYRMWMLGVLPAMREYAPGAAGRGDVDSGPLVFGASAPASVVMVAASRSVGDSSVALALTASADAIGWPVTVRGRRRYAGGALPVGDAFMAWASTVPVAPSRTSDVFQGWRGRWQGVGSVLVLLGVALVFLTHRGRTQTSSSSSATIGK